MTPDTTDGGPPWPAVPHDGRDASSGANRVRESAATEAELRVSAEQVALGIAFQREPSLICRIERVAAGRQDRPFALAWVGGTEESRVREALSADPSVSLRRMCTERDGHRLCELEFDATVRLMTTVIAEESGIVRAAVARGGAWRLHLRYPRRSAVGETISRLERFGIQPTLAHIGETDRTSTLRLTEKQRETVETAYRRGYFEVPRGVSLGELADELDVSHQALSERLRRAQSALLEFELNDGTAEIPPGSR